MRGFSVPNKCIPTKTSELNRNINSNYLLPLKYGAMRQKQQQKTFANFLSDNIKSFTDSALNLKYAWDILMNNWNLQANSYSFINVQNG